jgi:hypothetical protein
MIDTRLMRGLIGMKIETRKQAPWEESEEISKTMAGSWRCDANVHAERAPRADRSEGLKLMKARATSAERARKAHLHHVS